MNENQHTLSLLSPEGTYLYHDLTDQTINDLSLTYIAEQVGKTKDEKQIILDIMKHMPVSREVSSTDAAFTKICAGKKNWAANC